ncbi:MAG: hypothetical protein HYY06_00605 [Deltaproteobacteria bacterium]|nr:hypothetical protein [Deltaproteobacteria bacterium]
MKETLFFATALFAGCGGEEENLPPKIAPTQNPINFNAFAANPDPQDPCGGERPCFYDLQLVNDGNQTVEITGIEVKGDVRCAIQGMPYFEGDERPQTATIEGHGQIFLHIDYLPGGATPAPVGVDQIDLVISSNASDYPQLRISICGCVNDGEWSSSWRCECNLNEVPAQGCQQ